MRLSVVSVAGEPFASLDVDACIPSRRLRSIIAEKTMVPEECQRLVFGTGVLEPQQVLSDHVGRDAVAATATLVVAVEELYRRIHSPISQARLSGVACLAKLAPAGDERAVAALVGLLTDATLPVRKKAVTALGSLASRGDTDALKAAAGCLGSEDAELHQSASAAMATLVRDGEQAAMKELDARLEHGTSRERQTALDVLAQVTLRSSGGMKEATERLRAAIKQGDALAMSVLSRFLDDESPGPRRAALQLLLQAPESCRQDLVALVGQRLEHSNRGVRSSAVETLVQLMEEELLSGMAPCLQSSYEDVRAAALRAVGRSAAQGDQRAVDAAISFLRDPSDDVRLAAVRALEQVAVPGQQGEVAVKAVCDCLEHPLRGVRRAVAQALPHLAQKGDTTALEELAQRLRSGSAYARSDTILAIASIAEQGDALVVDELLALLKDRDLEVKLAAAESLALVARPADKAAVAGLLACYSGQRMVAGRGPSMLFKRAVEQSLEALSPGMRLAREGGPRPMS